MYKILGIMFFMSSVMFANDLESMLDTKIDQYVIMENLDFEDQIEAGRRRGKTHRGRRRAGGGLR